MNVLLKNISKTYGPDEFSLNNIFLNLDDRDSVAIVGDSGSGKSTILNMIAGIDRPNTGDVLVGGQNLGDLNQEALVDFRKKNIGFVFQAFHLIPHLNVFQNIALPCLLLDWRFTEIKKKITSILEIIDLDDKQNVLPNNLSGGEQQRVAIARAIIHGPKLVLADEPTGNLDSRNTEIVLNLLVDQCNKNHSTLVVVTHSEFVAKRMKKKNKINI